MEEIMTREDYFEAIAEAFIGAYQGLSKRVHELGGDSEETADRHVSDEINEIYPCCGDEQMYLCEIKLPEAYDAYCEQNEPLKIFEVCVSGSFSGTFRVKAEDEYEARDYVADNLEITECSMYLNDDEKLVDDFEVDDMSYDREVDCVNDTGEVYEDD